MVSSKDVAKHAGVSQSTVSRVLNNPEGVNASKRLLVEEAMRTLGYQPNLYARNLASKKTRTIALLSGTLQNDFFVESINSIVDYAMKQGYQTLVYSEYENNLRELIDTVLGYKVDGILLSSIKLDDPVLPILDKSGVPYMLFNRRPRSGGSYVVLDNQMAASMLTRHMLDIGHRSIAYLSGPLDTSTFYERKLGFYETLEAYGVDISFSQFYETDTSKQSIQKLTWTILQQPSPPSAIICATDEMALACMDAALQTGRRIPEDISLAGFDDISMASHQAIQLTSVGQRDYKLGVVAVEQLIQMIQSQRVTPLQFVIKPELFIRRTTARYESGGS